MICNKTLNLNKINVNNINPRFLNNSKLNKKKDDYYFVKILGKGGFSIVYLVKDKKDLKYYALKKIKKIRKGKDKTQSIYKEILALMILKHPNIIKFYGWFENNKYIYLLIENFVGPDLNYFFKNDTPDNHDAIIIFRQIFNTIKFCHDNNIIHRDIKLKNILIDSNLNIKIIDFGLCFFINNNNSLTYDFCGTPLFTSPDILFGNGYDFSTDLWSLGVTLYYIMVKKYPITGANKKELFYNIKYKLIDFNLNLDNNLLDLLSKLLHKNPKKRININDVINHPWLNNSICFCNLCNNY